MTDSSPQPVEPGSATLDLIAAHVDEPTPRGIAGAVSHLIGTGRLLQDDRLPTVRGVAAALGVSPATVSTAWQSLARAGLIVSRGRSGTRVRGVPRDWLPSRYRGLAGAGTAALDLSRGTPDPTLLPDLAPALSRVATRAATPSYLLKPDIPELHDLLRATWPSPVESLTVTNGALDALDRILDAVARFGDRVVVETPGFPPVLDLLERYGLEAVGVAVDAHGMRPDGLRAALLRRPVAVVVQPRAQNPTGASWTPTRVRELAGVLRGTPDAAAVLVVEDDHSGEVSVAPDLTLAGALPGRVLHIRSFSKSHGPDLRVGALGGPRDIVDRIVARRMLGAGWTSRMTQSLLHDLLTDATAIARVTEARAAYSARRTALVAALAEHGILLPAGDGLNLWLPVRDERAAVVQLASAGIEVAPGAPFFAGAGTGHVRVTSAVVRDAHADIARELAAAAAA